MVSARVPLAVLNALKDLAERNNVPYTGLLEPAIREFVERHERHVITQTERIVTPSKIIVSRPKRRRKREV